MELLSRSKLYTLFERNTDLNAAWLKSGIAFDDIRQDAGRCMDFLSRCDFSPSPKQFTYDNDIFQRVIFNRQFNDGCRKPGYRVSFVAFKTAVLNLGIPFRKTGIESVIRLPEPRSPEILKDFHNFYQLESGVC